MTAEQTNGEATSANNTKLPPFDSLTTTATSSTTSNSSSGSIGASGGDGANTASQVASVPTSWVTADTPFGEDTSQAVFAAGGLSSVDFQTSWSNGWAGDALSVPAPSTGSHRSVSLPVAEVKSATSVPSEQLHLSVALKFSHSALPPAGGRRATSLGISSVIHDAARIINWETVKSLCETNPDAAKYAGRDGWTALHHACNRRCPHPDVVEALLRAYPDALLEELNTGWTPLHFAARFKCISAVVRLLVDLFPDKGRPAVSKSDAQGRTPLYYAVRYDAPAGVAEILLEADASAVLAEDQNADSPLALVWDDWAEKIEGKRSLQAILPSEQEKATFSLEEQAGRVMKRLEEDEEVFKRWKRVNLFLRAAFGFAVDENGKAAQRKNEGRKWRILHATAAIKCHPSLFLLACVLYPNQALEVDDNDLHCPEHIMAGVDPASKLTALHLAASSMASGEMSRTVINQLLQLNPDAVRSKASDGSLPLHRVVQNISRSSWSMDGAENIYSANKDAIRVPDLNGQLPLHRASSAIRCHSELSKELQADEGDSVIGNLLIANSNAASHADSLGRFPLHTITQYGTEWDAQIESLYDAHPLAARARAGGALACRLPIHFAASNPSAKKSMFTKLLEHHARGASQGDKEGKLPLHLACEIGMSWKCAVSPIYEAFRDAIRQPEQNSRRWTALHMASSCVESREDLLSNLVKLHPANARISDSKGRCPLHLACIADKTWDTGLKALFEASPHTLVCPDSFGLLPFHLSAFRSSTLCAPNDGVTRPSAFTKQNRRISRAASVEAENELEMELQKAKIVSILFELLKASPTIL